MTPSHAQVLQGVQPAFADDAHSRLSTVLDPDTARAL